MILTWSVFSSGNVVGSSWKEVLTNLRRPTFFRHSSSGSLLFLLWPLPLLVPNITYSCPKHFLLTFVCWTLFSSSSSDSKFVWSLLSFSQLIISLSGLESTPQSYPSTISPRPQSHVDLRRNGSIFRDFGHHRLQSLSRRGLMIFINMGCPIFIFNL